MRLLVDENLSPRLARDQIVVTVNVGDFLRLAASMEVHPGVIALREAGLSAEQQWLRVQSALQLIQQPPLQPGIRCGDEQVDVL